MTCHTEHLDPFRFQLLNCLIYIFLSNKMISTKNKSNTSYLIHSFIQVSPTVNSYAEFREQISNPSEPHAMHN